MKAFVIKNNDGLYYTTHLDYEDIHTKDISVANILNKETANSVKLFLNKTTYRNGEKWKVVEITIVKGDLEQENERLKEQIDIKDKALGFACINIIHYEGDDEEEFCAEIDNAKNYFIEKAKKELKGENDE